MPNVYTTAEVSEALKMNRHTVGWLRKYGLLQGIKTGRSWIFTESEIESFLNEYKGENLSSEQAVIIAACKHKKSALPSK